jgi:hypothetical protein
MENLYYNLSEEEFSKSRKILLWIFVVLFFLGGVYVLLTPVFGIHNISPVFSLAPFGISFIVGVIAAFATIIRKDVFFSIDDEKIEFRYGLIRPKKHSFRWNDINKMVMPHKERKAKVIFSDGSSYIIDLSYIQRKKSTIIRKHLFHAARYKDIPIEKVIHLTS